MRNWFREKHVIGCDDIELQRRKNIDAYLDVLIKFLISPLKLGRAQYYDNNEYLARIRIYWVYTVQNTSENAHIKMASSAMNAAAAVKRFQ